MSVECLSDWFNNFYDGFPRNSRTWFAYECSKDFEFPIDFRFDEINHERFEKSRMLLSTAISPCILPVGIHQGRKTPVSYKFYHPMSAGRQLGLGQLPIGLFFVDKIQTRGVITSALMMDRLLNILGPPLGSIDNIELAVIWCATFDHWWAEWKKHLFHQSPSMYMTNIFSEQIPQTTKSSPPHISQSGEPIHYAVGIVPNSGGLAPSIISFNAPTTSSLLYGLVRDPVETRRKRAKSSDAKSPPKGKSSKKQKATATDDLPALDPDVEEYRDNEDMEEAIEDAAGDVSETREGGQTPPVDPPSPKKVQSPVKRHPTKKVASKKPSAQLPPPPRTPSPPWQESSERTPLAVVSCGLIRARFEETQRQIPDTYADAISPAMYLEQHRLKLERAMQRIADRRERAELETMIQTNQLSIKGEKAKLDEMEADPSSTQVNINRLRAREAELVAELEKWRADISSQEKKLANLPRAIEQQRLKLKKSIKHLLDLSKSLKMIPSTDALDALAKEEVEQIRQ
ncbi:Os06g0357000 [Oryza sativa Japonica Group]|uniref:Aminotransferase-like n=1 Tax=Oryza sativa subsp. japonica TaxID=39947 RepID=Q69TT8_ORYSJ|nr:aminotransferase-like [Oryza sativa Japonica Group]BAH93508.1 Os06g0357000 [Oryza sativa Japonica Group]|eukprot:NP_001174780.1 Os06g0357000 [Oryza sativa Japonica Group]